MKKIAAFIMAAAVAVSSSGCSGLSIFSNYREIEDLELIRTVGVDSDPEGVNVIISSGSTGSESAPRIYETQAPAVGVGLAVLQKVPLGKQALLSHTENMVLGEEEARSGIGQVLDYVERFAEMRLDTSLFIVKGGTARDLIRGTAGKNTSAAEMLQRLRDSLPQLGAGEVWSCKDVAVSLAATGTALVMAVEPVEEEKLFEERGDMKIVPAGFAIIVDGALRDYLDEQETRGALLLRSVFRAETLPIDVGDAQVIVTVDGAKTSVYPEFDDTGTLRGVGIGLELQANVINVSGGGEIQSSDFRRQVEEKLSQVMGDSVQAAIEASREMDVDFLGIQELVRFEEPVRLRKMGEQWEDIFGELEFQVKAEAQLRRTYDLKDPLSTTGEEETSLWEKVTG